MNNPGYSISFQIILFSVMVLSILSSSGCKASDTSSLAAQCVEDSDCVQDACCHATGCVVKDKAPNCEGMMCTMECRPGTLDCGGRCLCDKGVCKAEIPATI